MVADRIMDVYPSPTLWAYTFFVVSKFSIVSIYCFNIYIHKVINSKREK